MRLPILWPVLVTAILPTAAVATSPTLVSVPFVGCRSDGQMGPQPAPMRHATPRVSTRVASQLAYYEAADGIGVLAPRGWHCFGTYGSNGSGLFISPERFDPRKFFSGRPFGSRASAIEIEVSYGGTSGRWGVADAIARYFPAYRSFLTSAFEGLDRGPLPSGPYPRDRLGRHGANFVRYTTPPHAKGEGTAWTFAPSADPVEGLAALSGPASEPDLLKVRVRLPARERDLAAVILATAEANQRRR